MNGGTIDWQSALAVLAVGLAGGGFLFWRVRRAATPATAIAPGLQRRDLEARRDALLRQLRELDDTASKRTPDQLARERLDLELQAASVLRDLERQAPLRAGAVVRPAGATSASGPDRSSLRGFLWGTATASAIGLLLFFVTRASSPRAEGGSVTGTAGRMSTPGPAPAGAAPMAGPAVAGDIDAQLEQARAALGRQDMMGVWNATRAVLQREPGNPPALAYQALVRLAMGQGDVAETMLKQALATDPDLLDGYLHLGVVYARTGRMGQAETTLRTAMSRFPDERAGLQRLLEELRTIGPEGQVKSVGAHAGVAPPDAEGEAPAAGTPVRLSGVVEIDSSARDRAPAGGLVFVVVRAAGVTSGPPVAVKRFSAAALPGVFSITAADSMMGQELPERVSIEARLDPDGDPLTRSPTDPAARLDGVKLGTAGLKLVLK